MGPGSAAHHCVLRSVRGTRPQIHFSNSRRSIAFSRRPPPEVCSPLYTPRRKGRREGRVPTGTHGPLCACSAKEIAQRHTGEAEHTAFPAQWSDGLCRALPGAEFLLASLVLRKSPTPRRLTPMPHPQDLTVATTARTTRFCRTQADPASPQGASRDAAPFVQRGLRAAHGVRLNPSPRPATHIRDGAAQRPPQPDPRFVTTYDRPFRRIRMGDAYVKSEFR